MKGFTLIELVIATVIAAIILIPTSVVVVQSLRNTFFPEHFTVASSLLEDRIEWVNSLRFEDVDLLGTAGHFGAGFSDYSYKVVVTYVDADKLNGPFGPQDPQGTNYKRVDITILRSGFPTVSATTLRTNN